MNIKELIAMARIRSGKTQEQMGHEMGHGGKSRLSSIAAGRLAANPSEVRYLALQAKLDPVTVQGELEAEKHPALAWVWKMAVEPMQNGFASLKKSARKLKATLKQRTVQRRKSQR